MTTLEIDPRIEARRDAVRRATERRRMRVLVALAVTVVVVVAAYLTIESPILSVGNIDVRGTTHLSVAQVRAIAAVEKGRPLLRVDLARVADRVDTLPWVSTVKVDRALPRTLRITIVEARPVAFIRGHGFVAVLGPDDRVVAHTSAPPLGAIEISGVRRVPGVHELLSPAGTARLVDALPPAMRPRVRAISLRPTSVAVVLDHGEIRLGDLGAIAAKLSAAEAVMRQHAAPFSYIDVTVPSEPVLHP